MLDVILNVLQNSSEVDVAGSLTPFNNSLGSLVNSNKPIFIIYNSKHQVVLCAVTSIGH